MASRKSQATKDREASQQATMLAEHPQLLVLNQHLRQVIVERDAEILRIQALLRITQVKLAKSRSDQPGGDQPGGRTFKQRCLAFLHATGKSVVNRSEMEEWERDNVQA